MKSATAGAAKYLFVGALCSLSAPCGAAGAALGPTPLPPVSDSATRIVVNSDTLEKFRQKLATTHTIDLPQLAMLVPHMLRSEREQQAYLDEMSSIEYASSGAIEDRPIFDSDLRHLAIDLIEYAVSIAKTDPDRSRLAIDLGIDVVSVPLKLVPSEIASKTLTPANDFRGIYVVDPTASTVAVLEHAVAKLVAISPDEKVVWQAADERVKQIHTVIRSYAKLMIRQINGRKSREFNKTATQESIVLQVEMPLLKAAFDEGFDKAKNIRHLNSLPAKPGSEVR